MAKPFDRINEPRSEDARQRLAAIEPPSRRTYTPSLAVIAKSSGVFHWTADGQRLYDFTSGVLVTNLGHNSPDWMERFRRYSADLPLNAYNAATPVEIEASGIAACRPAPVSSWRRGTCRSRLGSLRI